MVTKVFNTWNDYSPLIDLVRKKRIEANLFSGREDAKKDYKLYTKELFTKYENNYNANNIVENLIATITIEKNIKKYFEEITDKNIDNIEDKLSNENVITVNLIKETIKNELSSLNIEENKIIQNFYKLMHEITKVSNKFTYFPITDENIDIFINSTPMYLQHELSEQDYFNSPIEEILFNAFTPLAKKYNLKLETELPVRDTGRTEIRYALDFAFVDHNGKIILNVEADGLNFHQSFQSMALDRKRDRWLLLRDIPVMRFTSREIFNNLNNCLIEVETYLKIKKR